MGSVVLLAGLAALVWIVRGGELPFRGEKLASAPVGAGAPAGARLPVSAGDDAASSETEPVADLRSELAAAEPLPELGASDSLVREAVAKLSANPELIAWLANETLIRRFVAAVDNVAEGLSPRSHLSSLGPRAKFRTRSGEEDLRTDPRSYARYDAVAQAVASLDAQGCARLYARIQPLVDQAYRDLGYPEQKFDGRLRAAVVELLEVPIVQGEPELVAHVDRYEYADLELELLSDAQKHLLRMGPRNVRLVQAKLREVARALGIPERELPAPRKYAAAALPDS